MHPEAAGGAVFGAPRAWLRAEGLGVFVLAVLVYARGEPSWILFAVLFFLPDVSFAGYAAGPRVGAMAYNVLHSYVPPAVWLGVVLLTGQGTMAVPLVWFAHIGLDRALGYGLKYPSHFRDAHLGRLGPSKE